jgi:hypothetical protein
MVYTTACIYYKNYLQPGIIRTVLFAIFMLLLISFLNHGEVALAAPEHKSKCNTIRIHQSICV